jgi:hypothetical protein
VCAGFGWRCVCSVIWAGDLEAAARLEAVRDLFGIDGAPAPAPDGLPGRNGPSPDTEGEDDADRNAR